MLERVLTALKGIRAPVATDEYDLHQLACQALAQAGIGCVHEAQLAPRCRIDVLCGRVGIEIKRGKPAPNRILPQLTRYCACAEVAGLLLVSEGRVRLPATLCGKPVRNLSLNQLWGIAL